MNTNEFKQIPSAPFYYINSSGVVLSKKTSIEKEIKHIYNKLGYAVVNIMNNIKNRTRLVHHLVMETYGTPKPSDDHVIVHKDRNKHNNHIDNLVWTHKSDVPRGKKRIPIEATGIDEGDKIKFRSLADAAKYFHTSDVMISYNMKLNKIYKGYLFTKIENKK